MIKVILIHGNGGGTSKDIWFPYLTQELTKLGITVINKDFPDNQLARERYWLPFIKQLGADENTILVGHSSGAIAAMRFAEKNKILGSVLVGTYHTDIGDDNEKKSGYFNHPWNWQAIRNNQKWILQFNSTDDPWVPIEEARFVNKKLKTKYFEFTDQGHFGRDYDKKTFPELLLAVKEQVAKR